MGEGLARQSSQGSLSLRPPDRAVVQRDRTMSDIHGDPTFASQSPLKPIPPKTSQRSTKNFRVGRPLPKWGESLPSDVSVLIVFVVVLL